ncbi:MAG: aspartate--ammonia ligase, partial [Clostridia bacterium]|nr:aspartate--ammonia ligase [Clostridia bacterium]
PLFVQKNSGINDTLNGVERPVRFDVKDIDGGDFEIVHSLAKWKRMALGQYGFGVGEGLYTDMNAIRRDEDTDNIHSIFVDQWDWEKIIRREDRNLGFLFENVRRIVGAIVRTNDAVKKAFPVLDAKIDPEVSFISSQELEDMYPDLTPKERETAYVKTHRTAFISGIGGKLRSGKPHDGRAPDYDDWDLNGDILVWNDVLGIPFELSSMGIRVDETSLARQLELAGCPERAELYFHRMLLAGELPLTMGGGIGQSRLCMLMMQTAHIGEVQASVWDRETLDLCAERGVKLL